MHPRLKCAQDLILEHQTCVRSAEMMAISWKEGNTRNVSYSKLKSSEKTNVNCFKMDLIVVFLIVF